MWCKIIEGITCLIIAIQLCVVRNKGTLDHVSTANQYEQELIQKSTQLSTPLSDYMIFVAFSSIVHEKIVPINSYQPNKAD